MTATVDLSVLQEMHDACVRRRVKYVLGAKAPLGASVKSITAIDCSGFVRWVLYGASGRELKLPDGSWHQAVWCDKHLRKLAQYSDVHYAAEDPSRLFIAYLPPNAIRKNSAGHIWLVRSDGQRMRTYESRGGKGPSSRVWDAPVLLKHATGAWEVPAKA